MKLDPQAITVLLGIITGLVGMPLIQYVKQLFGLEDKAAFGIASGVSILLGVGVAFANGAFTGQGTDLNSIIASVSLVFTTATAFYKVLTEGKPAEQPEEPEA